MHPERRSRFLTNVAGALAEDDALLLGIDLVKDLSRLESAYNDTGGVTESFVRNALTAVNGVLDATFEQRRFAYEARWDPEHEWMDIGFRAREAHAVAVPRFELVVAFEEHEQLRIEISAKFRRETFEPEARDAGLRLESWWTDQAGDFAVALLLPND
jgi:L-histidine N-alpha-methyltransferase